MLAGGYRFVDKLVLLGGVLNVLFLRLPYELCQIGLLWRILLLSCLFLLLLFQMGLKVVWSVLDVSL